MPTGSKLWRMKFRQMNGKESRLAFGSYPDVGIGQAREQRTATRKLKIEDTEPCTTQCAVRLESFVHGEEEVHP
jgi:hypothetical protein